MYKVCDVFTFTLVFYDKREVRLVETGEQYWTIICNLEFHNFILSNEKMLYLVVLYHYTDMYMCWQIKHDTK